MPKLPRLHHAWFATALIAVAGLSLTTYSERVLVPQGFAPAGLGGEASPPPSAARIARQGAEHRSQPETPAPAPDQQSAHRLIAKQAEAAPGFELAPGLAAPGATDPADREVRRLLRQGGRTGRAFEVADLRPGQAGAQGNASQHPTEIAPSLVPSGEPTAPATPVTGPAEDDVAAAVPEPSTWIMLLLGLGVLGHALRAARRSGVRRRASS